LDFRKLASFNETVVPLPDAAATLAAAHELAADLTSGSVVALVGPLGAGKTTFIKAVAAALGVAEEVTSPSFVRMHIYKGDLPIYHLDLYRVEGPAEFLALGLDEWLDTDGVTLIEWAERAAELLPVHTITVTLDYSEDALSRTMTVAARPPGPLRPREV